MFKLIQGDCLEVMPKLIEDGIKADLVLTDPPYGTTACKWDSIIPFEPMWECLNGLTYDNTPIVLFGSEPFSSTLRMSNIKDYKYDWVWEKEQGSNFMLCKKQPMKNFENINVFYKKQPTYNPQMRKGKPYSMSRKPHTKDGVFGESKEIIIKTDNDGERYPLATLYYARDKSNNKTFHSTQKPVKLLEYLIKTYTNEDDLVLDFTMGSGSTGVACMNTNRQFIGIELDKDYYQIAQERCKNYQTKLEV